MNKTYDYIIVGGGSAGCVLANRLSADPSQSVCLLEAGPRDDSIFIRVPLGIAALQTHKILNWRYETTPQTYCANRVMVWSQGRTLGGCSSVNANVYIRGNPIDFENWAKLGNTNWSYQDVLPFFIKQENLESGSSPYHGQGGPMNIQNHARFINPLAHIFLKAAQQAGYTLNANFNAESQEGVGLFQVNQKNGERLSNATAYLHPIEDRKNLSVITDALVLKILVEGNRAIGVRYCQNGQTVNLHGNEIILSAGTVVSPAILLRSGIGPANQLKKLDIPVITDLPGVGENLQDHLDIHLTCYEKTFYSMSARPRVFFRNTLDFFKYLLGKQGAYTSNVSQVGGFLTLDKNKRQPDIQFHFIPCFYPRNGTVPYFDSAYTVQAAIMHPFSRGSVTLKNSDPFTRPLINPNYLADERDLDVLVAGFKAARAILHQPAFEPHCRAEFEPGKDVRNDEDIKNYIRTNAQTASHPVGTCKMGIDNLAVVDPNLRVHTIQHLRVVDASIMPLEISGNTNATVTMIAEKAAAMIIGN